MQAKEKRHSTSEEALQVARDCGAYRTVLTHFSQRYPKLPPGLEGPKAATAAVAFDGMCIPLIALLDLPKLLPLLHTALLEREEAGLGFAEPADLPAERSLGDLSGSGSGGEGCGVNASMPLSQHIRFDELNA